MYTAVGSEDYTVIHLSPGKLWKAGVVRFYSLLSYDNASVFFCALMCTKIYNSPQCCAWTVPAFCVYFIVDGWNSVLGVVE